ncbi:conjugal transfer protein TraX [Alcanivorax sp. JB21]|uniref:TraX family protein n=1 Tax=Alcanivorax limicola TaxID=2874102 RepID=UPI001CBFFA16|nr:TraX family protein [Alcanivorax limicola]MBZ2190056.1 conjugal transfer protein TraX [Alcanivorax limicola]
MTPPTAQLAATRPQGITAPSSAWTAWGQWLALLTMTADHLSRYVLPDGAGLDWIESTLGRVAFPLFAAMVAWHGLFNTRNPARYARRILVIGLAAQIPFMLMPRDTDAFVLNVCFTLSGGLFWAAWLRDCAARYQEGSLSAAATSGLAAASLPVWYLLGPWVEYGHVGLMIIPLMMLALAMLSQRSDMRSERFLAGLSALPVLLMAAQMNHTELAKAVTVATCASILILAAGAARYIPRPALIMPRRLWLAWYPVHFLVIAILLWVLTGIA